MSNSDFWYLWFTLYLLILTDESEGDCINEGKVYKERELFYFPVKVGCKMCVCNQEVVKCKIIHFKQQRKCSSDESLRRKRQVVHEKEDVFKELERELNPDDFKTDLNEKEESEKIFQELRLEMSTPRTPRNDPNHQMIEKITDAIAKLAFGGRNKSPLDNFNLLSTLTSFFNDRLG